jgi:hypothetical protein
MMMLLQKGHVTTAAQRVQRAMDGNLYALRRLGGAFLQWSQ